MANEYLDLTDLLKINDAATFDDLEISDLLQDAPLFARLAAGPSSNGTQHKYLKETGAPTVGFRAINVGLENSKSADTLVTVDLKVLDASFSVDKAYADAFKRGPEAAIMKEAKRHLKAAFAKSEQQVVQGDDAAGFNGLADALPYLDTPMVYGAGGDTVDSCSSIYFIRTNDDQSDVSIIGASDDGESARIEIDETVVIQKDDGTGKFYPAYYTPIMTWLTLQVGGKFSLARICNIDFDHTVSDDLIYEALALFPSTRQPNLIVMNRTSQKQLRASRTATNATGAPAPRPTEVEGIPILVVESITNTEAVVANAP